jgi:hypothetical protein
MITIQKNGTKLKVSKGAFDTYFKGIGFKVVGVKAEETEKESKSEGKENEAPKTPKNENPKK